MAKENYPSDDLPYIKINGVSRKIHNDLLNISKNSGLGITSLLKPKLVDWINSYPDHMKLPPKKD